MLSISDCLGGDCQFDPRSFGWTTRYSLDVGTLEIRLGIHPQSDTSASLSASSISPLQRTEFKLVVNVGLSKAKPNPQQHNSYFSYVSAVAEASPTVQVTHNS